MTHGHAVSIINSKEMGGAGGGEEKWREMGKWVFKCNWI